LLIHELRLRNIVRFHDYDYDSLLKNNDDSVLLYLGNGRGAEASNRAKRC